MGVPDSAIRRVVIVHERFTEVGGSEQVVAALHRIWPDAVVLAPLVAASGIPAGLRDIPIQGDRLRWLYRGGRHSHLLPLLPMAIRRLPVGRPDLVVTSHHSFAQRVQVPPDVPVLSYVHSPATWIWQPESRPELRGPLRRAAFASIAAAQRRADRAAAARPDLIVANSRTVQRRVRQWWGRDSEVIHPPVDVEFFTPDPGRAREDFYLLAGRLVPGKSPEVAVRAASRHGARLVVAGDGWMRRQLTELAGPTVTFLGRVSRVDLRELFRCCRAVLVPGEEDFGMVTVEAAACGTPVVALAAGGSLETVVPGRTGVLYPATGDPTADLAAGLEQLNRHDLDAGEIRGHALGFSAEVFATRIRAAAERLAR